MTREQIEYYRFKGKNHTSWDYNMYFPIIVTSLSPLRGQIYSLNQAIHFYLRTDYQCDVSGIGFDD